VIILIRGVMVFLKQLITRNLMDLKELFRNLKFFNLTKFHEGVNVNA